MQSSRNQTLATIAISALISSLATYYLSNSQSTSQEDDGENSRKSKIVFENITTRRTVSTFEPDLPLGWEDKVNEAIQAAITAPNHKRTEPWRFYIPDRETIVKICELNASIVAQGKGGAKAGEAKLKKWLKVPGWIVVTCVKNEETKEEKVDDDEKNDAITRIVNMEDPKGRDREDYAAVCCACQNMCLALHSHGFGTKWTTGKVNFDKRFDDLVGIPENEYVVGTFWFGVPTKSPSSRETKHGVNDVLTTRTN